MSQTLPADPLNFPPSGRSAQSYRQEAAAWLSAAPKLSDFYSVEDPLLRNGQSTACAARAAACFRAADGADDLAARRRARHSALTAVPYALVPCRVLPGEECVSCGPDVERFLDAVVCSR